MPEPVSFDDLIPQQNQVSFDDLIPQQVPEPVAQTQAAIEQGQLLPVFEGLPIDIAQQLSQQYPVVPSRARGDEVGLAREGEENKFFQAQRNRAVNLEKIRLENPWLAEVIEEVGPIEGIVIGAGKRTEDYMQALKRAGVAAAGVQFNLDEELQQLLGNLAREDALDSPEYKKLASVSPMTKVGETATDVAVTSIPGARVSQVASTPLRIAGEATLGGAVSGGITAGQGGSGEEIAKNAAIGAGLGAAVGEFFNYGRQLTPRQQQLKAILETNPDDATVASYVLRSGRPEKLRAAQTALDQNIDPRFVGLVKEAGKQDKAKFKDMLQILKRGRENLKAAKDARPTDVLGRSLADRFKEIKTMNKQAGQKIDDIARSQLKGKNVDLVDPISQFRRNLAEKLRVTYDPRTGSLNFEGSALTGKNAAGARAAIKDISRRLRNPQMDASDAHFLKRVIDNQTTFGKSAGGLSGDAESIIKDLRRNINESIRDISPSYKNANIKYSDTITDIENFKKAVGPSIDINAPNAEKAIGTVFRGLDSNNKSRIALENSAFNLQETAKKYGVTFKDDIKTQAIMANALEERFGSFSGTSFQGGIERAGARLLDPSASNFQKGAAVVNYGKEKIKGVTDEKAIEALLRLSE